MSRPTGRRPSARQRLFQPGEPEIENIREAVGIVPGDAVAASAARMASSRVTSGSAPTSCCGASPKPARLGMRIAAIGLARIVDTETGQHLAQAASRRSSRLRLERRGGERRRQQHDAEIGVVADRSDASPRRAS